MNRIHRNKSFRSGITVLMIGLVFLGIAFVSAAIFLLEALPLFTSQNLTSNLGEAFSPLIATAVRVMYLGVMIWAGSVVTSRGITLMRTAPKVEAEASEESQEKKLEKLHTQAPKAKSGEKNARGENT